MDKEQDSKWEKKAYRICIDLHNQIDVLYESLADGGLDEIKAAIKEQKENLDYIQTLARKHERFQAKTKRK